MAHRNRSLRRGHGAGGGAQNVRLPHLCTEGGDVASLLPVDTFGEPGRSKACAQAPERRQRLDLLKHHRRRRHFEESGDLRGEWADQECRLKWERLRRERAAERSSERAAMATLVTEHTVAETEGLEQSRDIVASRTPEKNSKAVAAKATAVLSTLDEAVSLDGRALPPVQTPRVPQPRPPAASPPRSGWAGRRVGGAVGNGSVSTVQPRLAGSLAFEEDDADEPMCPVQWTCSSSTLERPTSQEVPSPGRLLWPASPGRVAESMDEPHVDEIQCDPEPECFAAMRTTPSHPPSSSPPRPLSAASGATAPRVPVPPSQPRSDAAPMRPRRRGEEPPLAQSSAVTELPPQAAQDSVRQPAFDDLTPQPRPFSAGACSVVSEPFTVVTADDEDSISDDFVLEDAEAAPEGIVERLVAQATKEVAAAAEEEDDECEKTVQVWSKVQLGLEENLDGGTREIKIHEVTENAGKQTDEPIQESDGQVPRASGASSNDRSYGKNTVDEACEKARSALEYAMDNGTLPDTLRQLQMQKAREQFRLALVGKLECGTLEKTVQDVRNQRAREKVRSALEKNLVAGTMERRVQEIRNQKLRERELREKLRLTLQESMNNGTLEQKVHDMRNQKVRAKMRSAFEDAVNDGTLEKRLHELKVQKIREKIRLALEDALDDGSLETSMQEATTQKVSHQEVPSKVDLSGRIEASAVASSDAEEFPFDLDTCPRSTEAQDLAAENLDILEPRDHESQILGGLEDLETQKTTLLESPEDGNLPVAFEVMETVEVSLPAPLELHAPVFQDQKARAQIRFALEDAMDDGSLEKILHEIQVQKIREQIRLAFEDALDDGSLEKSLREVTNQVADHTPRVGETGADDGLATSPNWVARVCNAEQSEENDTTHAKSAEDRRAALARLRQRRAERAQEDAVERDQDVLPSVMCESREIDPPLKGSAPSVPVSLDRHVMPEERLEVPEDRLEMLEGRLEVPESASASSDDQTSKIEFEECPLDVEHLASNWPVEVDEEGDVFVPALDLTLDFLDDVVLESDLSVRYVDTSLVPAPSSVAPAESNSVCMGMGGGKHERTEHGLSNEALVPSVLGESAHESISFFAEGKKACTNTLDNLQNEEDLSTKPPSPSSKCDGESTVLGEQSQAEHESRSIEDLLKLRSEELRWDVWRSIGDRLEARISSPELKPDFSLAHCQVQEREQRNTPTPEAAVGGASDADVAECNGGSSGSPAPPTSPLSSDWIRQRWSTLRKPEVERPSSRLSSSAGRDDAPKEALTQILSMESFKERLAAYKQSASPSAAIDAATADDVVWPRGEAKAFQAPFKAASGYQGFGTPVVFRSGGLPPPPDFDPPVARVVRGL